MHMLYTFMYIYIYMRSCGWFHVLQASMFFLSESIGQILCITQFHVIMCTLDPNSKNKDPTIDVPNSHWLINRGGCLPL